MAYTDLSQGFNLSFGSHVSVRVQDGRVRGLYGGRDVDFNELLPWLCKKYVAVVAKDHPAQDFFWDFHIDDPSYIGITCAYKWKTKKFVSWLWTERDNVELPRLADHKESIRQFMEPKAA